MLPGRSGQALHTLSFNLQNRSHFTERAVLLDGRPKTLLPVVGSSTQAEAAVLDLALE